MSDNTRTTEGREELSDCIVLPEIPSLTDPTQLELESDK